MNLKVEVYNKLFRKYHELSKTKSVQEVVRIYIFDINAISNISPEEEKELLSKIKSNSIDELVKLVYHNLKLVFSIVGLYARDEKMFYELIEFGNIKLIDLCLNYHILNNINFSKYITRELRFAIKKEVTYIIANS